MNQVAVVIEIECTDGFDYPKVRGRFTAFMLAPKPTAAASKKIQEDLTALSGSPTPQDI